MMKQLAAVICAISLGIGTVYCECFRTTYSISGTAGKCSQYGCTGCCSHTDYSGVCTDCGPATGSQACYKDESYTVWTSLFVLGDCPANGTCGGGLISGDPQLKTCYYTSNGSCS